MKRDARRAHPQVLTELTRDATLELEERAEADGDGRTILVRLMRWGEEADTPQGRETFLRGAFAASDPRRVLVEAQGHGGAIVGRGEAFLEDQDGPVLRARVSDTVDGRDLLTLIRDGVLRAASVVFLPTSSRVRRDGVVERVKADLRRVAILPSGAYQGAEVLAVRSAIVDEPEPTPTPVPEPPDLSPILARLDRVDDAIARVQAQTAFTSLDPGVLSRFDSAGDAFLAASTDPAAALELHRALADNVLHPDNAALDRPQWLNRLVGPISWGRPIINAFGVMPAPSKGMTMGWPVFDPTSDFSVDEQATEKTEIESGKVKWKDENATLKTYAGGSDNSLQLLERSEPSYRELLLAEYARQYAYRTEAVMAVAVTTTAASGPAAGTVDISGTKDVPNLLAALFAASAKVETETGEPASFVLAAPDVFGALGAVEGLWPGAYGTQNVGGTAQASTLAISISGLTIRQARQLPAGKLVISNGATGKWAEDGPRTIEALNVAKLGRDIAIYGFGVPVLFRPAGIVVLTATLPTP
jgi:HK97 family phage prohead protease